VLERVARPVAVLHSGRTGSDHSKRHSECELPRWCGGQRGSFPGQGSARGDHCLGHQRHSQCGAE
jgi:hypothetical protein